MKTISHPEPADVHEIKDRSLQALVVLGISLDLGLAKTANAYLLMSPNLSQPIAVPMHSGVRQGKYKSLLQQVCRGTPDDIQPGPDLVDEICRKTKCPPERQRLIRQEVVAWWPASAVKWPSTGLSEGAPEGQPMTDEEWKPFAEAVGIEEPVEFVEVPAIAHMSSGTTYESKAAVQRIYSDLRDPTIHCVICGEQLASIKSIGGHRRKHVQKGEVPRVDGPSPEDITGFDPEWQVTQRETDVMAMKTADVRNVPRPDPVELPPLPDPDPMPNDEILYKIRELVFPGAVEDYRLLGEKYDALWNDYMLVINERDQLRSSLGALRDMLTDLTKQQEGGGSQPENE